MERQSNNAITRVVSGVMISRRSVDGEREWREACLAELETSAEWPNLPAVSLNERRIYRGQAGIFADFTVTCHLASPGVAVSVMHTGRHYADDLDDDFAIYHYPKTNRPVASDANEIQSVKNAQLLGLPIFFISQRGNGRTVRKGWVVSHDDNARVFLIEFGESTPRPLAIEIDDAPFERKTRRDLTVSQIERRERSTKFRYQAATRYGGVCVVSGIDVYEMLEGAHVIPVKDGGSDDPRNGLLINAAAHRAFDARLWAINPTTLKIETKKDGPDPHRMRLSRLDLSGCGTLPHRSALEWRYEYFRQSA